MTAISARGVHVDLHSTTALSDVDIDIATGSWACLVGPNGAGKTTLLRAQIGRAHV